jgi:hypothetical protein
MTLSISPLARRSLPAIRRVVSVAEVEEGCPQNAAALSDFGRGITSCSGYGFWSNGQGLAENKLAS